MVMDKTALETAINRVKALVPARQDQPPALLGVLVNGSTMTAYNGVIGVTCKLEILSDEVMLLPAALLDLIPKLPEGSVELVPDGKGHILVRSGRTRSKVICHPAKDFPSLPAVTDANSELTLDGKMLESAIKHCLFAVSASELKPALTGMLFEIADGKLNIVACDSLQLARYQAETGGTIRCIIPKQALQQVAGLNMTGSVKLMASNRHIMFESEGYTVISRLLEGSFLDYASLLKPKKNTLKIKADLLMEALDRAIALAGKNKASALVHISDKGMIVQNQSAMSDYAELVELEEKPTASVQIGFNPRLLMDSLRTFKGEIITFSFSDDPLNPVTLTAGSLSVLTMPIRIKGQESAKKKEEKPQAAAENQEAA